MGLKEKLFITIEKFGIVNVIKTLRDLQSKYGSFYEPDRYLIAYNSS
jgi:hypothetical protein